MEEELAFSLLLDGHKQSKIVQPSPMLFAERTVSGGKRLGRRRTKRFECAAEQPAFIIFDNIESDLLVVEAVESQVCVVDKSIID